MNAIYCHCGHGNAFNTHPPRVCMKCEELLPAESVAPLRLLPDPIDTFDRVEAARLQSLRFGLAAVENAMRKPRVEFRRGGFGIVGAHEFGSDGAA